MKRLLFVLLILVVVIAAIAVVNAARFTSRQPPPEPPVQIAVDEDAAAAHLAGAIRFETVSYEESERVDRAAFEALHGYLEQTYPAVHATLAR